MALPTNWKEAQITELEGKLGLKQMEWGADKALYEKRIAELKEENASLLEQLEVAGVKIIEYDYLWSEQEKHIAKLQKEIEALQKDATREYHGSIAPGKEIRLDQFTMWLRSVSLEFEHQASQSPSEWGELQSLHDWVDEIRYMV
jgi:hypothetical protein